MIKALVFDFFGTIRIDGKLDQELLDYISELKKTYKIALLSNVIGLDKYVDLKMLGEYFEVIAMSDRIGFAKPDPQAYLYVLNKLAVKPSEAVMIDDLEVLVEGAESVGMQGILYKDLKDLKSKLANLLHS